MNDVVVGERAGTALGPVRISGTTVRLRPPRYGDFARWRALRLRDQAFIEPFWSTSALTWEQRHTEQAWVREVLDHRLAARRGDTVAWVIEADGQLVGQANLTEVDRRRGCAEAGIWVESGLARQGVAGLAMSMLFDDAFTRLGLTRVVAPVASENVATQRGATAVGMTREADMAAYFHAGGVRRDHTLFAVLLEDTPEGGFVSHWLARRGDSPQGERRDVASSGRRAMPTSWRGRAEVVRRAVRPSARVPRQRRGALVDDLAAGSLRLVGDAGGESWDVVDGQRVLGRLGLRRVRASLGRAEVFWQAGGLTPEQLAGALRALVDHAFATRRVGRLEAVVWRPGDEAVVSGAGLLREGTLRGYPGEDDLVRREVELWAVTRDDASG